MKEAETIKEYSNKLLGIVNNVRSCFLRSFLMKELWEKKWFMWQKDK